jgi:uncharacterized repeat protein (TIGR01451 family)
MIRHLIVASLSALCCVPAGAAEVTVRNDSLEALGTAAIVWGFVPGEKAGSWLTSPCNGNLRAVQVFWRSPAGTSGQTIHTAIDIHRAGTFPNPGALALNISGPVLTDGVLNEYRYLDENQTIPIVVPVAANETVVVVFEFDTEPVEFLDPSLTRDTDGNTSGRNSLYARLGPGNFVWFNSATFGLQGDWIIRAVIDCAAGPQLADVGVGMQASLAQYLAGQPLGYTIVIDNAGPVASPSTTIVDIFPPNYQAPTWTCLASGGASCIASGSGNITQTVNLPVGGAVTYSVNGTVAGAATGLLSNTVTAVVGGSVSDPMPANNTQTLELAAGGGDFVFANGFED